MKQCNICNELKPESSFRVRRENGKLRNDCIDCRNAKQREYYWNNKERLDAKHAEYRRKNAEHTRQRAKKWQQSHPEARRSIKYKYHYGISIKDYEELLSLQGGVCATCGCPPNGSRLYVDHIHVDGYKKMSGTKKRKYVRGLLCYKCNMAIGMIGDNPRTLANMASYLERCSQGVRT